MVRTFKTRVYPTAEQRKYLEQAFGVRRWTWNWALARYFDEVKEGRYPDAYALQKYLNNNVVGSVGFEWLSEVNSMFRGESLKDFGLAIKRWKELQALSRRNPGNFNTDKGKPKFKKKGKCVDSARMFAKSHTEFKIKSAHVFSATTVRGKARLELKTKESIEFLKAPSVTIKTCTFSREAGRYYISLTFEKANQTLRQGGNGTVGIDLGIKHLATCWDGTNGKIVDVPSTLHRAEKYTERLNALLSRKVPGSNRYNRTLLQLQRAYAHEANIKKDFREKFTTELVEKYNVIKIDDFSFDSAKNLKNAHRALYRVGVYAFKERLTVKAAERGVNITKVKPFTPTTKTCSQCGYVKKSISLKTRVYECPQCGNKVDRDLNAAMNVYNLCS